MRVKICGLTNAEDALAALAAGADALGFVMGGWVEPAEIEPRAQIIREFLRTIPSEAETYLVTHLLRADDVLALAEYVGTTGIQVSEYLELDQMCQIRKQTRRTVIKTIVTSDEDYLDRLAMYEPYCDWILTDSRVAGYVGGTGVANDWERCRQVAKTSTRPTWVAGGLTPENVAEAIKISNPAGVDVSSGVSHYSSMYPKKDRKDPQRILSLINNARIIP